MLTIQLEDFTTLNAEAQELFSCHAAEVTHDTPALDVPSYLDLERHGGLIVVTARRDGKIIGYFTLKMSRHQHFNLRAAASDMIFVTKSERKHGVGSALMTKALDHLRWLGISRIYFGMKVRAPFRKLLRGMGFEPEEEIWVKEL